MKDILKFIVFCSLSALLGLLLAKFMFGQPAVSFDATRPLGEEAPSRIEVKGGVSGAWLVINRANKKDPRGRGFDPSYTYMISDFKPMVKQLKSGKWQIQFECSICEGLP